jgi:hypothetical protein
LRSQFAHFTLVALRDECRRRELATTGSRGELVQRLVLCNANSSDTNKKNAIADAEREQNDDNDVATTTTTATTTAAVTSTDVNVNNNVQAEVAVQQQLQFSTPTKSMLPARTLGLSQSERRPAHKRLSSVRADDAVVAGTSERSNSADGTCDGRSPRRRLSVGFKAVEIREYERLHGGSGGVPYVGAYPLGLGWQVAAERRDSLSNFESERSSHRKRSDDLPRIEESERRKLLEKHDARPRLERAASYVAQRRELDALRKARSAIGCSCSVKQPTRTSWLTVTQPPQCCSTDECECYRNGLECWDESCACGNRLGVCLNPHLDKGPCSDVPAPPPEATPTNSSQVSASQQQ